MTKGRRRKNPAARIEYAYAGSGQYLALLLDHRGRVLEEAWGTKDEVLDWIAERAEGLPMIKVHLIEEPNENPRFRLLLHSAAHKI